jgi:hypothetical protein
MVLPLRVETEAGFERHRAEDLLVTAVYGAVVLTMFIYNLFLYVTVRDRSYLAYCVSILAIFVAMMAVDGWHLAVLGDNTWLKQRAFTLSVFVLRRLGVVVHENLSGNTPATAADGPRHASAGGGVPANDCGQPVLLRAAAGGAQRHPGAADGAGGCYWLVPSLPAAATNRRCISRLPGARR